MAAPTSAADFRKMLTGGVPLLVGGAFRAWPVAGIKATGEPVSLASLNGEITVTPADLRVTAGVGAPIGGIEKEGERPGGAGSPLAPRGGGGGPAPAGPGLRADAEPPPRAAHFLREEIFRLRRGAGVLAAQGRAPVECAGPGRGRADFPRGTRRAGRLGRRESRRRGGENPRRAGIHRAGAGGGGGEEG